MTAFVAVLVLLVAVFSISSTRPPSDPWPGWLAQPAWNDYRAGERAADANLRLASMCDFTPVEIQCAFNDYRAGERAFVVRVPVRLQRPIPE